MKKYLLFSILFLTSFLYSQEKNLSLKDNTSLMQNNFLRPGVSFVTIRYNGIPNINQIQIDSVISQFDIIKIENNDIVINKNLEDLTVEEKSDENNKKKKFSLKKLKDNISETVKSSTKGLDNLVLNDEIINDITKLVRDEISGQHIFSLLSDNNGKFDNEKIYDRVRYTLTESQLRQFSNLTGSDVFSNAQTRLLDPILQNNYIIVIIPYQINESENNYSSKFITLAYKVEISEGVDIQAKKNVFFQKYGNNLSEVKNDTFPVTLINQSSGSSLSMQFDPDKMDTSEEGGFAMKMLAKAAKKITKTELLSQNKLRQNLDNNTLNASVFLHSKKIDEFKPRTILLEKMYISLGTKEGLKIDDRVISYEKTKDENGDIILVRKGIDRVKKVAENSNVVQEGFELPKSKLYGDAGKKSKEGYLSVLDKDYKIGVSLSYKETIGIGFDLRTSFSPNLFFIVDVERSKFIIDTGYYDFEFNGFFALFGVQKNINIGRIFAIAPYLEGGLSMYVDDNGDPISALTGFGFATGLKLPVKLGTSFQLIPELQLRSKADAEYSDYGWAPTQTESNLIPSLSLRFNF